MSRLMEAFPETSRETVVEVFTAYQNGLWEAQDAGLSEPQEWLRIEREIARQYDLCDEQRDIMGNYASRVVEADIERAAAVQPGDFDSEW